MESIPMNDTAIYWLAIVVLCLCFPPLFGLLIGIAIYLGIWWIWLKMLGG